MKTKLIAVLVIGFAVMCAGKDWKVLRDGEQGLHRWLIHYKIYKHGVLDQDGYGSYYAPTREAAIARLKWESSGEGKLRVLSIEREAP